MRHAVRGTLFWLGAGAIAQRLLQLAAFLIVGRNLGAAGLGVHAQGAALAAALAIAASAGSRNLTARAIAREPAAARSLVRAAVAARLWHGAALAALAAAVAWVNAERPWLWTLWSLHALPAAFDLKNLLDAGGRARAEVALEQCAALLQFALVTAWAKAGGDDLATLAAISLVSRIVYAAGAAVAIRALGGSAPAAAVPGQRTAAAAQTAHELVASADVALVAVALGDAAAGFYAAAARFAAAALLPSAQLARLLLPHLLHAADRGDPRRTLGTALRATAFATLPMLAGGAVVAADLCALAGGEFTASAAALRLLLLAGCLQHLGWHASHTLLAAGRYRTFAHGLGWPALGQAVAVLALAALARAADPAPAAAAAAALAALANAAYAACGCAALGGLATIGQALRRGPLPTAAATAAAALAPAAVFTGPWLLPAQLGCGALALAATLWRFDLRGRLRKIGDGLAAASGFGH